MDEDIHKRICEILLEEKGLAGDETKMTDEEFEDKLKNYIGRKLDLVPRETVEGRIIDLKTFNEKYVKKSPAWIKHFIFSKFQPEWVEDLYPGKGKPYRIHEYQAAKWMEKHSKDIDWEGRIE